MPLHFSLPAKKWIYTDMWVNSSTFQEIQQLSSGVVLKRPPVVRFRLSETTTPLNKRACSTDSSCIRLQLSFGRGSVKASLTARHIRAVFAEVNEMATFKCNRKKPKPQQDVVISSLKKENAYLKKSLFVLSRQHSEHNKLVERLMERMQQAMPKDEKVGLTSEQLRKKEGTLMDGDPGEQAANIEDNELQNRLNDALEKNKQWLDINQQREAYLRAILARVMCLEKQLNEASQASSQPHNGHYSEEKECIGQMLEHYEGLRETLTQQLKITQNWCKEMDDEVEEKNGRKGTPENPYCSEDEEQQLRNDETKDLQSRLDKEKRRSASFKLQANLCQKLMLNCHQEDQKKIENLERQIKISSQDLEDERQDCEYLKKQVVGVLKMLAKKQVTKKSKQDCNLCEAVGPPPRETFTSSANSSMLNESLLECPNCSTYYPASQYRELMTHLEYCLN